MSAPKVEEVFKTNGVPTFTFVEPREYTKLIVSLRTPGRGLVIEGPSGIGKTTAVQTALALLGVDRAVTKLSARQRQDIDLIADLPNLTNTGTVIIDDFHKLEEGLRGSIADYLKMLADAERSGTKLIVVGINQAGERLIDLAHDLVNRLDIITFETNSDEKVDELVSKGECALNITINVKDEIVNASQGSFYLAQMLSREVCLRAKILEAPVEHTTTETSFENVRSEVWERLAAAFRQRTERFCLGTRLRREGRAPYLHVLHWLSEGQEWSLSLRKAIRAHQDMSGSVGQIVEKGHLGALIQKNPDIAAVLHYDATAQQLTVEDPQYFFFLRYLPWKQFAADLGFRGMRFENKYDFALSFAGSERSIAEGIFRGLQDAEVEVFYDHNEQHRIVCEDIEEYLRPIYQSDARFVICLLSANYPQRIWAKIESDAFKERFKDGDVFPVFFTNAPPGMFDESRKKGGYIFDPAADHAPQINEIVSLALRKLRDTAEAGAA
jgi:hypothetical protein